MNILAIAAVVVDGAVILVAAVGLLLTLLALALVISMAFARRRVEHERAACTATKGPGSAVIGEAARF